MDKALIILLKKYHKTKHMVAFVWLFRSNVIIVIICFEAKLKPIITKLCEKFQTIVKPIFLRIKEFI